VKRVVIVQARVGSTRLPRKVFADLAGRPMLAQVLRRLARCRRVDEVMVATTEGAGDAEVVELARREGVGCFRGSEHDVLGRYLGAARAARADVVVRVTSDCPLIDSATVDRVVAALVDAPGGADYAANVIERTFPRGLDTEAFFIDALERMARLATSAAAREHVTRFLLVERPDLFLRHSVTAERDDSDLRWTVDEPDDLALARRLYGDLGLAEVEVPYPEIVAHVRRHPELTRLNDHVRQKA